MFVGTWNAGSTDTGTPYRARWPDEFGNLQYRDVPRPRVIAEYFQDSDCVDRHNKSRQFDLGLELAWRTPNCWLRADTTFFGLTAVDAWNAVRYAAADSSGFRELPIVTFVECVIGDLWSKKDWGAERPQALNLNYIAEENWDDQHHFSPLSTASSPGQWSARLQDVQLGAKEEFARSHMPTKTTRTEGGLRSTSLKRRVCSVKAVGCYTSKSNTMYPNKN